MPESQLIENVISLNQIYLKKTLNNKTRQWNCVRGAWTLSPQSLGQQTKSSLLLDRGLSVRQPR